MLLLFCTLQGSKTGVLLVQLDQVHACVLAHTAYVVFLQLVLLAAGPMLTNLGM
jgi:hypothetical protein